VSPVNFSRHSLFFNITSQHFVFLAPGDSTPETFRIEPSIINQGYSLVGTPYGAVITG
jgi:hypothetical protein